MLYLPLPVAVFPIVVSLRFGHESLQTLLGLILYYWLVSLHFWRRYPRVTYHSRLWVAGNFESQRLANTAWSLATLQVLHHGPWLQSISAASIPKREARHADDTLGLVKAIWTSGGDVVCGGLAKLIVWDAGARSLEAFLPDAEWGGHSQTDPPSAECPWGLQTAHATEQLGVRDTVRQKHCLHPVHC